MLISHVTCLSQSPHINRYPERRLDSFVCITCMLPLPSVLYGDSDRAPNRIWESSRFTRRIYVQNARYYSGLWRGDEVAQTQSIQQTGFVGIRQRAKKKRKKKALPFACLISTESRTSAHMEKPVVLCVTPLGSDSNLFLYPLFFQSAHCQSMN